MPAFPTAFLFTPFSEAAMYKGNVFSLVICFVPRILAGLTPIVVSDLFLNSRNKSDNIKGDVLGSIAGSMTNTVLVLLMILVFFGNEYSSIVGKNILTVLGMTVLTNGIPEAIICAIVCPVVVRVLKKI